MEKNIVALTENELENISGGKKNNEKKKKSSSGSYFEKGFLACFGALSALVVVGLICRL